MTAVPAALGRGVQLICDGCGRVATADGCGVHDADVVYVAVASVGWTGSPFARGPHRCSTCDAGFVPAPRHAPRPVGELDLPLDRVSTAMTSFAALIRVKGDIDRSATPQLREALDAAVVERAQVVVDLSQSGTIDSTGLGILVRARQAARRRSGELYLAAPSRFVQTVLRTMRLHSAFRTSGSLPGAMAAAASGARRPAGDRCR